jgi:hypothetical protein
MLCHLNSEANSIKQVEKQKINTMLTWALLVTSLARVAK